MYRDRLVEQPGLEGEDTGCPMEEYRHEMMRDGTQVGTRDLPVLTNSSMVS